MHPSALLEIEPFTTHAKNHVVPFIDLKRQYFFLKDEILAAIHNVLSSGQYILGTVVEELEKNLANYLGCQYVVGVANGTDALIIAFKSLNIGLNDEVILPVNSFISTAAAVVAVGAKPVLCDVEYDFNIDVKKIEPLITKKTKAIVPVHLTGRPAKMDAILEIAKNYSLSVIEDAAQSIGAKYKEKMTGTFGEMGCFSLHPLKNLHVYGDGGLITTNCPNLYQKIKLLRNHGLQDRDTCIQWGLNSRLDSLQATIANLGLPLLDEWNKKRRSTALHYQEKLKDLLKVPQDKPDEFAVYHNFIVLTEKRDQLMTYLAKKGIETKIHYPIPIHLQPAALSLGYQKGQFPIAEKLMQHMLSLPIYAELQEEEITKVTNNIISFFQD